MISIICVYNKRDILSQWLLKSLKNQSVDYEIVLLDNSNNKFTSAAEALNYGGKQANGKYLMFVHQDVKLCSNDWLFKAENYIKSLNNAGIIGIAGVSEYFCGTKRFRNIILEKKNPTIIWGNKIEKPEVVQTLDECLFIIPKTVFDDHVFDKITCPNWHFYAVDYCLSVKNFDLKSVVIPLKIHHQSLGYSTKLSIKLSSFKYLQEYYSSLKLLIQKHQNYKLLLTTNGSYRTDSNVYLQDFKRILMN